MRIRLLKSDLDLLFIATKNVGIDFARLALLLKVSQRNLRDWRSGKISLPERAYLKCLTFSKLNQKNFKPIFLDDYWYTKKGGKKGAVARMLLYGNLGTPEGRKKGGLASIRSHSLLKNSGFKILRQIRKPDLSEELAELMGILIGDGHLSGYQVIMTTNSVTDRQHAIFVKNLIEKIFNLPVKITYRKYQNAMNVTASSKNLVEFIHSLGMPQGDKIKNNLEAPAWVMDNELYQKAFIRGLFDTDGCVYLDKHIIRGKSYKHLGWTITSYAGKLREGIIEILRNLGFNPTYRVSQKSVYLRRQKEIQEYFLNIGTSNQKHKERYLKFSGEVPKWS